MKKLFSSVILLASFVLIGCQQFQPSSQQTPGPGGQQTSTGNGKLYSLNMADCGGFSAEDASAVLGIPAADLTFNPSELYEGAWMCSYREGSDYENIISLSVTHADSVEDAILEMEQFRDNLSVAAGTVVGEGVEDAYSDISGIGDDALWTEINNTLNVRKGNVSLQILLPNDKTSQLKVAELFMADL